MEIKLIHGIILIILLGLCLLDMPYGYFIFVRFVTAISCAYRGYQAYLENKIGLIRIFVGIAILFQPFLKVHLGRFVWNIVDVALAVFILCMMIFLYKKNKSRTK